MFPFLERIRSLNWTRGKKLALISLILFCYLLVGAAVFEALEANNEAAQAEEYRSLIAQLVSASSLNETEVMNITSSLQRLQAVANAANGIENWAFAPSFFFALTVVTTIVTAGGQAFCCVYALIGIPITGVVLVKIADILKDRFNSLRDRLQKRLPDNFKFSDIMAPLIISLLGVFLFLFIPAVVFRAIEGWTYGESLYYAFITLSTIGFGDFVAGQESNTLRGLYKVLLMVWIFVGLAFLTLLLEVVNDMITKTAEATKSRLKSSDSTPADGESPRDAKVPLDDLDEDRRAPTDTSETV